MTPETGLQDGLARAEERLFASGIRTLGTRRLTNGIQATLQRDGRECRVNYYFSARRGFSAVPAGGDAFLLEAVAAALGGEEAPVQAEGYRIGTDEAGKGDWFGPLTVAGAACDDGASRRLVSLGVADSKTLSDPRVLHLMDVLLREPGVTTACVCLDPPEYNRLFREARARGMNSLDIQAMAHGRVITQLRERTGADLVVVDRFCCRERLAPWLPPGDYRLSLRVRAEDDPVVAAASIVARGTYLNGLRALSARAGMRLCAGAGSAADAAGRELVRRHGPDALENFVKLHFRNSLKALGT